MSSKSEGSDDGKKSVGSNGERSVNSDGVAGKPNADEPGVSGNPRSKKRLKQLDARALENLIRWSIDLTERQQNLLKTALDVVTNGAEG